MAIPRITFKPEALRAFIERNGSDIQITKQAPPIIGNSSWKWTNHKDELLIVTANISIAPVVTVHRAAWEHLLFHSFQARREITIVSSGAGPALDWIWEDPQGNPVTVISTTNYTPTATPVTLTFTANVLNAMLSLMSEVRVQVNGFASGPAGLEWRWFRIDTPVQEPIAHTTNFLLP